MKLRFTADLPRTDVAIGVVVVDGVEAAPATEALRRATERCIEARRGELSPELEARRVACREMLRNGSYKPTGRGKPASEYLLRAAHQGTFPQINGLVDANNLVSLEHMVPISVWDLDLSGRKQFVFRLGAPDESYVFNSGGQVLALKDLLCGCEVEPENGTSTPIVNAIKDCLRTKTTDQTKRVAAAVYYPLMDVRSEERVGTITAELGEWLLSCGPEARAAHGVLVAGGHLELQL